MKKVLLFFLSLFYTLSYAQKTEVYTMVVPDSLKENANAVVKLNQTTVDFLSEKQMIVTTKRVVTVLNKNGESHIGAHTFYDKSIKVNNLEVVVYNQLGQEIKKIRRKDFKDQSVADGFSVFTDNRMLYLDYTATEYPYTVEILKQIETSNTAVLKPWMPVDDYYLSVLKDEITINNPLGLQLNLSETNIDAFLVQKKTENNTISYSVENVKALKYEEYSPGFEAFIPMVKLNLKRFNFEGITGEANNWKEYGKWYYDHLVYGTEFLDEATKNKVLSLKGSEKDPITIAKILYKYLQDKSRYVSVQVGIGGWRPMLAKDVDRLGYGDCKGLSNYMRSLLKVAGVESYLTLINAGTNKKNTDVNFVYDNFNHMILTIPIKGQYYFLECTSQVAPFNYQGSFTDNRYALLLKPEGGELVKTYDSPDLSNKMITKGSYSITSEGSLKGEITIQTFGNQYDDRNFLEGKSNEEQTSFYKDYFSHINNFKTDKVVLENNKNLIRFSETIHFQAAQYANVTDGKMFFSVNAFNLKKSIPKRYRKRIRPFEIERGYSDYDELLINLPEGYSIESMPENYTLKTKFGEYLITFQLTGDNTVKYTRSLSNFRGKFAKEEYDEFRKFNEQVARNDNSKIILIKSNH